MSIVTEREKKCSKSRPRVGCLMWRLGRWFSHRQHPEVDSPLLQQHQQGYSLERHRPAVLVCKQIWPGQTHRASQHLSMRLKNRFRRNQVHLLHLPEVPSYRLPIHLIQKPVLPLHQDHTEKKDRSINKVPHRSDENENSDITDRMMNTNWCICEHCSVMATAKECVSCREFDAVNSRLCKLPSSCSMINFRLCLDINVLWLMVVLLHNVQASQLTVWVVS